MDADLGPLATQTLLLIRKIQSARTEVDALLRAAVAAGLTIDPVYKQDIVCKEVAGALEGAAADLHSAFISFDSYEQNRPKIEA